MRFYIVLLASLMFWCACKNNGNTGYHLPPKTMGKLLVDIHLAEAYSSLVKKDSANIWAQKNYDSLASYYKDILAHYNITQEQFGQSMDWYRTHPADLDSIYEKMLPEINRMDALNKKIP